MGFENGSVSFRIFYVPRPLPGDSVDRFAKTALPPLNLLGKEVLRGWVGGRHLLDREINEDNAFLAGYLRLHLVKAERKIPAALLRAECTMEELALMQAEGKAFLSRAERSQIRKDVNDRLLPQMPPTLTGIPIVYDGENSTVYAGATSEKKTDVLLLSFSSATEVALVPLDAASGAMRLCSLDVERLDPVSFSPEVDDASAVPHVGMDFLTWLWYYAEACGGVMDRDGDALSVMVEGPITLFQQGDGAHVALLRQGVPTLSTEAKTALLSGKKLRSARLTLARGKETWSTALDAMDFTFRGFKFPQSEERLDAVTAFQQRMLSLHRFTETFLAFYKAFLDTRLDPSSWEPSKKAIHQWVQDRVTKR